MNEDHEQDPLEKVLSATSKDGSNELVPNAFPKIAPTSSRLAVVGEAPGADELVAGVPFVGTSGRLLRAVLAGCGVACDQIFFGNVCQHRPPDNDIDSFDFDGPEIQAGLERLRVDLQEFRPNCVLLLGKTAFRAFRPDLCYPTKKGHYVPLSDWRGSLFRGEFGAGTYKCTSTYHPAYILRAYADMPYFKFDVARAVGHSKDPAFNVRVRDGNLRPILSDVLEFIARVRRDRIATTWDIEGYADDVGITMLSLTENPFSGIVIPFWLDGQNYWTVEDEVQVWQALAGLLADPLVRKKAHNFFYELFVSAWRHKMIVNNAYEDTMFKHWELFPEAAGDGDADDNPNKKKRAGIGRSLADLCSIYTEQPFYKADRLSPDPQVKLKYNLTDSQVTDEADLVMEERLKKLPLSYAHYRFNINLIPPLNYIMLRGCRFDVTRARELRESVQKEINDLTLQIDSAILDEAIIAGVVTRKRKSDDYHFNVDSGNQLRWLLYTRLKYKPLKKYVTPTGKDGTSEDVLLHYWTKEQNPLVRLVIRCVRKRTRLSDIEKLRANVDGRIRSSFDPVGTNTARLSSRKSNALELVDNEWIHTGTNLQNVTKDLRVTFIPDSLEHDFWQFDLAGADAWTVAADLAALGHPAMLDDMLYGIKPALVLYYMLQEKAAGRDPGAVNRLDRAELKSRLRLVKAEIDSLDGKSDQYGRPLDWQYLCCKRCQHGTNYDMRPDKLSEVIFGDSDGNISLSYREAELMQYYYRLRYNPQARQDRIARELRDKGWLQAACGVRRQFFNVRNRMPTDSDIREASAFEPQANTTWATNKALERLWYDVANRTSRGGLFIEPLLQVHDAIAGQYKSRDREWAANKLKSYFDNPLVICGTKVTIPADGKWGTDWKNCRNAITN